MTIIIHYSNYGHKIGLGTIIILPIPSVLYSIDEPLNKKKMNTIEENIAIVANGSTVNGSKNTGRDSIAKRLLSFIHGLDAEFPLSGGETNSELRKNIKYLEHEGGIFLHSTNGSFPLTGA